MQDNEFADWQARATTSGRAVILVLECSNRMAGSPLQLLKSRCSQLIHSLSEGQRFGLVAFGSSLLYFDNDCHFATPAAKRLADEFLNILEAMMENSVEEALHQILYQAEAIGSPVDVLLFGKGTDNYLPHVADSAKTLGARIHCFDFSTELGSSFHYLSRETGGHYLSTVEPETIPPIQPSDLPRRYFCVDTALFRCKPVEVTHNPDILCTLLIDYVRNRTSRGDHPYQWVDPTRLPDVFNAAMEQFKKRAIPESVVIMELLNILSSFERPHDYPEAVPINRIGGSSAELHLELRMLLLSSYRQYFIQKTAWGRLTMPDRIPDFLMNIEQKRWEQDMKRNRRIKTGTGHEWSGNHAD